MPVLAIGFTALLLGIAYVCWRMHRRLAAALAEADLYRNLFNSSSDAIFLCDAASGRILRANQPFATLYGCADDIPGQLSLADIGAGEAPYSGAEAASWIEKAKRGEPQLFEWRARRRDGAPVWVEVSLSRTTGGGQSLVLGTLRDISARKLAEARTRSLEARLAQVFENIPVPVFAIDEDHRVTHWNRACEIVFGTPAAAMIGTDSPWRAFYPTARPVMADVVLDGMADDLLERFYGEKYQPSRFIPNCFEAEDFFPQLGNGGVWLSFTAAPLLGEDGRPIGAIETLLDISEKKIGQITLRTERRSTEAALIEERNFLNSLLEAIPLPVFYKDRDGVYLGCNEAFLAGTGRTRDAVIGKTVFDMAPIEIAQRYQQMDDELFAAPGRQVYEWLLKRPSGEERNAVFNKATFTHQNGEIAGIIGVILDVTELKQTQQRLEELNRELEQRVEVRTRELRSAMRQLVQSEKIAALGHLVAGVAHELNTPIGTMLTLASAFEDRLKMFSRELNEGKMTRSTAAEDLASMIGAAATLQRNAHRAAELVASFKQVAVDQASTRRRSFDLAQTVREVLQTLAPLLRHQGGIEVSVEIPGGIVLDSFPGPLEQVLTNLFTNSLAHGFEHRGSGRIEITGRCHEDSVVLRYADNGKGIEVNLIDRIFDPFFTTKLGQGGSGLGLYIVYNLVTGGLGGTLQVSSEPGAGACFEVVLPLSAPEPRPSEPAWPKREQATGRDDYVI